MTTTPWRNLRRLTPARIALGRAGVALPTSEHLSFQLDHARARKAVHLEVDFAAVATVLQAAGLETVTLHSAATDRPTYLQRPDLGRRLADASALTPQPCDIAIVLADGLSATAIHDSAVPLLETLLPALQAEGYSIGPVALVKQARVAIGDEIGAALGARLVLVLIGERPGLSSPDSLGAYLTYAPRVGLTDEARNCLSNIRAAGLSPAEATHKLLYLIKGAIQLGQTGVALKDDAEPLAQIAQTRSLFAPD